MTPTERLLLQDLRFLLDQPRTKIDCRLILLSRIERALAEPDVADNSIDAERYRKLRRYMASNVKEGGWDKVVELGAVAGWMGWDDMDRHLDDLTECNVGLSHVREQL